MNPSQNNSQVGLRLKSRAVLNFSTPGGMSNAMSRMRVMGTPGGPPGGSQLSQDPSQPLGMPSQPAPPEPISASQMMMSQGMTMFTPDYQTPAEAQFACNMDPNVAPDKENRGQRSPAPLSPQRNKRPRFGYDPTLSQDSQLGSQPMGSQPTQGWNTQPGLSQGLEGLAGRGENSGGAVEGIFRIPEPRKPPGGRAPRAAQSPPCLRNPFLEEVPRDLVRNFFGGLVQHGIITRRQRFAFDLPLPLFRIAEMRIDQIVDREPVFAHQPAGPVGLADAAHAAEGYMRHYGEDANFRILTAAREQGLCLTYQRADEIADLGYRRACYDRTGIADRLSLVRAGGRDRVALSLYRSRAAGPFAEGLREAAAGAFPLLLEVVDRHLASLPPAAGDSVGEQEARLRRRFPGLTPRECAVAARVLTGQSASRIAAELGIAESTVVTHRKRAYARIGVDGMKALFRA